MNDSASAVLHTLRWPEGLDAQRFLDVYWQKKPLLLRQALPDFDTPISPDELAGLALEEDTTPRLILRQTGTDTGQYSLEHGPFDEYRFATLEGGDWSLLVTDVEKHLPELKEYLRPFGFLPSWRIDDLMISYAPDGASVGAHVDQYDVFLLQASGTRQWQIDSRADADLTLQAGESLQLLASFEANESWDLLPGDILYLPPGVPHHGIAVGDDCTTWSIGFRAPSQADILTEFSGMLSDVIGSKRFRDPPLTAITTQCSNDNSDKGTSGNAGEITPSAIDAIGELWNSATTLSPAELINLSGVLLTHNSAREMDDSEVAEVMDASGASKASIARGEAARWSLHPFSRAAYVVDNDKARLFVDGQAMDCSIDFAKAVCCNKTVSIAVAVDQLDKEALELLVSAGCLQVGAE